MNYLETYNRLVAKARSRGAASKDSYAERHHIVPRSEGGSDDKQNLVDFTAREHYIAHLLLAKIYRDQPMYAAVMLMCGKAGNHKGHSFRFNSRLYEKLRVEFGRKSSEAQKGKMAGKANPMFGKSIFDYMTPEKIQGWRRHHAECAEQHKGYRHLDRTRKKISSSMIGNSNTAGFHWYNDGVQNVFAKECPAGFRRGRKNMKAAEV